MRVTQECSRNTLDSPLGNVYVIVTFCLSGLSERKIYTNNEWYINHNSTEINIKLYFFYLSILVDAARVCAPQKQRCFCRSLFYKIKQI